MWKCLLLHLLHEDLLDDLLFLDEEGAHDAAILKRER
jgi:hypothetical protein